MTEKARSLLMINELIAMLTPVGEAQLAVYQKSVRLADSTRDLDLMFSARLDLVRGATRAGHGEKAITAFSWCLAEYEKEPERYHSHQKTLLWSFKYILHAVDEFPQISLVQIEELREQMVKLYDRHGYNKRAAYYTKFSFDISNGDREQAKKWSTRFQEEPRDEMADCLACETSMQVKYFALLEKWEQAVKTAEPILDGSLSCDQIPYVTYARILRPLAMLKRYDEADLYQKKGYRLIRKNSSRNLELFAEHIVYLLHRKRIRAAANMLERHLSSAMATSELRSQYEYYSAAKHVLTALSARKPTAKLRLPQEFPLYEVSNSYNLEDLIRWFDEQKSELGFRFNDRNGNDIYTEAISHQLSY